MKKFFITLVLAAVAVVNANAMSVSRSSREARFLTDKMAWELNLNTYQIEDIYEINYDYFRSLASVYDNNIFAYEMRNQEIQYVLTPSQWIRYKSIEYFFTPVHVVNSAWVIGVHNHYAHNHFYYSAPAGYRHYDGGHAHNKNHYMARVDHYRKESKPVPHNNAHVTPAPHKNGNVAPNKNNNVNHNNNNVAPNKNNNVNHSNNRNNSNVAMNKGGNNRTGNTRVGNTRAQVNNNIGGGARSASVGRR